jgi:hypothetical protein
LDNTNAKQTKLLIMFMLKSISITATALALAWFPGTAWADTTPNLYEVQGGRIHIVYSTSGFDGKPHFNYRDGRQTLNFAGADIRTVDTEIGTLVTVTTVKTVDTGSTTFTLVVPRVNVGQYQRARIRTQGITTVHKFSVIPSFNQGQTEVNMTTLLTGTASSVAF